MPLSRTMAALAVFFFPVHCHADFDIFTDNKPSSLSVGDLNGNKYEEIVSGDDLGNIQIFDHSGSVLWSAYVLPGKITGIKLADLDADGYLDIVASASGTNTVLFLIQQTQFPLSFSPQNFQWLTSETIKFTLSDLNGDGFVDVATTDIDGSCEMISNGGLDDEGSWLGFELPIIYIWPYRNISGVTDMASGDFNGDGLNDIAVSSIRHGMKGINVFYSDGDNFFHRRAGPPISRRSQVNSLNAHDFDGDGACDILVTNYDSIVPEVQTSPIFIYMGKPFEEDFWIRQRSLHPAKRIREVSIGDVNFDGLQDFVALFDTHRGNFTGKITTVFGSDDGLIFPSYASEDFEYGSIGADRIETGNIDGVGDLDFVIMNFSDHVIHVLEN